MDSASILSLVVTGGDTFVASSGASLTAMSAVPPPTKVVDSDSDSEGASPDRARVWVPPAWPASRAARCTQAGEGAQVL